MIQILDIEKQAERQKNRLLFLDLLHESEFGLIQNSKFINGFYFSWLPVKKSQVNKYFKTL